MDKKRVVCCVLGGQLQNLRLITRHLLAQPGIDEVRYWFNVGGQEERTFLETLSQQTSGKFTFSDVPGGRHRDGVVSAAYFYHECREPNTIYIKLDEDVCWMAPGAISRLARAKRVHPEAFLVYGNIVNHNICGHIHQNMGLLPQSVPELTYEDYCPAAFILPEVAQAHHKSFLRRLSEGRLREYEFTSREINTVRASINAIAWAGEDMHDGWEGVVDEHELAVERPKVLGRPNIIIGNALFVHFAYSTQRPGMPVSLLPCYEQIAREGVRT